MKNNSKTSLFLMELIIVILFFSIASVVCVQLFVNAYRTNEMTKESSKATMITQNLSEGFYGCDGDIASMQALFDHSVLKDGTLYLFYDEEWNAVNDEGSSAYIAKIAPEASAEGADPEKGGTMINADISVYTTQSEVIILSQKICVYVPYRLEDLK